MPGFGNHSPISTKTEYSLKLLNDLLTLLQPAYLFFLAFHKDNLDNHSRDKRLDYFFIAAIAVKIIVSHLYKFWSFKYGENNRYNSDAKHSRYGSDAPGTIFLQDFISLLKLVVSLSYAIVLSQNKDKAFPAFLVTMVVAMIGKAFAFYTIRKEDETILSRGGIFQHTTFNILFGISDLVSFITIIVTHHDHTRRFSLAFAGFILAIPLLMKLYEHVPCFHWPAAASTHG